MARINPQEELIELRGIHDSALALELNGTFEEAHDGFNQVLRGLEAMEVTPDILVTHTVLMADSLRDDSYTSLRQGLVKGNSSLIKGWAYSGLHDSRSVTAPFIVGDRALPDRRSRSELFVAHAKTEGCLGRLVVAKQIMDEEINPNEPAGDEQRLEQHWFGLAYKTALGGNSAYTGASIAVTAARAEVANGNPLSSPEWLRRAGNFILLQESEGLRTRDRFDATKTVVKHLPELRSRKAAMAASTHWRRV